MGRVEILSDASLTWEMPVCKIFTGGVEVVFQWFLVAVVSTL